MREFASASARAATLPRAAKALYTAFCAFVGLGIASCAGLYDGIVAFATRATPGELYARLIAHYQTGISTRALLEVTHAHLFVFMQRATASGARAASSVNKSRSSSSHCTWPPVGTSTFSNSAS